MIEIIDKINKVVILSMLIATPIALVLLAIYSIIGVW